jgi:catechol 2,3-dioxygenase-like lactoylglutathione lyase family enzyme
MLANGMTPILNVSDLEASFAWFARLGWEKLWQYDDGFAAVRSGTCELFLCQGAQGGRGRGDNTATFGEAGDESADRGVWMSLWVDDVDAAHRECLAAKADVTFPPTDMPWGVREMHVRHPDGHVFRISRGIEHDHEHEHDEHGGHIHEHGDHIHTHGEAS